MNSIYQHSSRNLLKIKQSSIFLFALFAYPYVVLSIKFYNPRLISSNAQLMIMFFLFLFLACLQSQKIIASLGWKTVSVLFLILFVFIPIKIICGEAGVKPLQGARILFMLPLFYSLYCVYVRTDYLKNKVVTIIIWNCIFVACFGIIHFFFSPYAFITDPITGELMPGKILSFAGHSREAAFLCNPSAYASLLLTGLLGIYLTKRQSIVYSIGFGVIFIGLVLSVSRWSVLLSVVVLMMFLQDNFKAKIGYLINGLVVLILVIVAFWRLPFLYTALKYAYDRWHLTEAIFGGHIGDWGMGVFGSRIDKTRLGLEILFSDVSHFLLGGLTTDTFVKGDISVSDNSFVFVMISCGVILGILWIIFVLFKVLPLLKFKGKNRVLLLIIFYGTILTTPALFWDFWVLYILGILHFAFGKDSQRFKKHFIKRSEIAYPYESHLAQIK